MEINIPQPVRPGAGLTIVQERLTPIRHQIQEGTYEIDQEAQDLVQRVLDDPNATKEEATAALNHPSNKGFRNAYTSLAIDEVWPPYLDLVDGEDPGVYKIGFSGTQSALSRRTPEEMAALTAFEAARRLARSNQDVPTHLICEQFRDGESPVVTQDEELNRAYFEAFRTQSELLTTKSGNFFETVPSGLDASTKFIASGLLILRSHVMGVPNLIDGVTEREGIRLDPDQHRNGVEGSVRKMAEYYLPTGAVTIGVNSQLLDFSTGELNPDKWVSNQDPNNLIVYPDPKIVAAVNESFAGQELPPQTNCPAFHSRVEDAALAVRAEQEVVPLPRSLARTALSQLDRWYYPLRRAEHDGPRSFSVSAPEFKTAEVVDDTRSFPDGLFVPRGDEIMSAIDRKTEDAPTQCPVLDERESHVLAVLGGAEGGTKPFSSFMEEAASAIIPSEIEDVQGPSGLHGQIQRFYRRALVDVDGTFDASRTEYAASDRESFARTLFGIELTRVDGVSFTAGDVVAMTNKLIQNPDLYPERARKLMRESFDIFVNKAVLDMTRSDSPDLGGDQVQRIKETTNGLHAALLFDLAHGESADAPGYGVARDRYIASKLAYQYHDEILDVTVDSQEGSANLLTAFARDENELNALQEAHGELAEQLPALEQSTENPASLSPYLRTIQRVAPKSYARLIERQHGLLSIAALPAHIASRVLLPELS